MNVKVLLLVGCASILTIGIPMRAHGFVVIPPSSPVRVSKSKNKNNFNIRSMIRGEEEENRKGNIVPMSGRTRTSVGALWLRGGGRDDDDDGHHHQHQHQQQDPNGKRKNALFTSKSTSSTGGQSMSAITGMFGMIRRSVLQLASVVLSFVSILREEIFAKMSGRQRLILLGALLAGVGIGRFSLRPFWTRYTDVMTIPGAYFDPSGGPSTPTLAGRAVTVTDGDTIRFLHVPTPFHPKNIRKDKGEKASTTALPIRICTIDTPETAKFGKEGQPFGKEAKEFLSDLIGTRPVHVRLLQKDQYGRAVAQVFIRKGGWFGRLLPPTYVDESMLRAGLAEVYQGGGAVYGPRGLDKYLEIESKAQSDKIGIWSQKNRESAAEFKKRTKS